MKPFSRSTKLVLILALSTSLSACGVVSLAGSVAGAVVDVGSAVVTTGVKAVGAMIPDGKDEPKAAPKAEGPASAPAQ